MSLWLVRHAKPLIASGTCYGMRDVPADAEQTEIAAQALALELPQGIRVQVSPLMRCQQLGQALDRMRTDLHFETDANLREMDFGSWEGVAWDDIPRAALDAWTQDFGAHRFGGKESANEVMARVAQAWDAVASCVGSAAEHAVWISHAGVAQAAQMLRDGKRQAGRAADWPASSLGYGGWVRL